MPGNNDNVLWLELEEGGYVSDASRALEKYGNAKCYMALSDRGLAVTMYGGPIAELGLDGDQVVTDVISWFCPAGKTTEEMESELRQFVGRKVLYRAKRPDEK